MASAAFRIAALDPASKRNDFHSGVDALDRYFHERVSQDIRRHVTSCFVALNPQNRIVGFYTLAASSVLLADLPEGMVKRLPRYPTVPAIRMGRLAVDQAVRGKGLGAALLADALLRCLESAIVGFALVVDAKDDRAAAFYLHHGFVPFASQPRTLFLPLATARAARS
jgi:GNAT superfamily N-acetyltransferase